MSSALAIASITAILKDLLNNGLIDNDVNKMIAGDVTVTALAPDRLDAPAANAPSSLNIFLYNVSANSGWRNIGQPSRDTRGDRTTNAPLALDLHYLLSAYGRKELDAEVLLGYGMQLLHETPVLTRAAIRRSLMPPTIIDAGTGIPDRLRELSTSELAEQVEQIKITPQYLTAEDISRLWTAFGAKYKPSAAYLITVVLIESKLPTRTPLPVRFRNLYVRTFQQPVINELLSQKAPGDPIVRNEPFLVGQNLVIRGEQLKGDITVVRLSGTEIAPDPANVKAEEIIVTLPATLQAGVQGVQIVHRIGMGIPEVPHGGMEGNLMPFVLRPRIDNVSVNVTGGAGSDPRTGSVTVKVAPDVTPSQRATLLLSELQPPSSIPNPQPGRAYSFPLPPRNIVTSIPSIPPVPIGSLVFPFSGVRAGKYVVRVQVDGADSLPVIGNSGVFDAPLAEVV